MSPTTCSNKKPSDMWSEGSVNHPVINNRNTTMFLENISSKNQVTMNSQEIADLVQSRHDKVKQSIERLAKRDVIIQPPMVDEQSTDAMGRSRTTSIYVFSGEKGKRDSLIVVAQLCPEFTGAIVDRWIELEKQAAAPKLPTNYLEALEQLVEKEKLLIAAQPKIQHYDRVVERSTLLNATQVAQKIGMTAQRLNKRLEVARVYNRAIKRSRAFNTWFVEQGLGEMKQTANGYPQALFTTKGEAWVVENFGIEEA